MLSFKNLTISVAERTILRDVSLSIPDGKTCLLSGPNGSGKSSLIAALSGDPTYHIQSGLIEINGNDVTHASPDERARAGLLTVFQYHPELPGVVWRNFLYEAYRARHKNFISPETFEKELCSAFALVGLPETYLERGVHDRFSGGEKKRAELATALILKPTVLLLDEVDSGLDHAARNQLKNIIKEIRNRVPTLSILAVSHSNEAFECFEPDFSVTLHQGKFSNISSV